jgi:hypothetical protein
MIDKLILDACCGGRVLWVDGHHPSAVYIDFRFEPPGLVKSRPNFFVDPDLLMDFTDLKFENNTFKLIVWDPPHGLSFSRTSIMAQKFGCLNAETWQHDLKKGFKELWRVLEDHGVLIFKWNDMEIPYKKVLSKFSEKPLFMNITAGPKTMSSKGSRSYWFCFMKIPKGAE